MSTCTVKELKKVLENYDDNTIIVLDTNVNDPESPKKLISNIAPSVIQEKDECNVIIPNPMHQKSTIRYFSAKEDLKNCKCLVLTTFSI